MKNIKRESVYGYPDFITRLPEADLPFEGIRGWLLQADKSQLVFFEFESDVKVPEHSHSYPQWGFVIAGKMELVVEGKTIMCEKGSEYLVLAEAKHFANFLSPTRVIDYFTELNRYKAKLPEISKAGSLGSTLIKRSQSK